MSEQNSVSAIAGSKSRFILRGIKFILISYVVSACLIGILAVLLTYTDCPESSSTAVVMGITLFGAFISAFLTARGATQSGWLWGMVSGICNVLILAVVGKIIYSSPFSSAMIWRVMGGGLCGALGGILGINSGR